MEEAVEIRANGYFILDYKDDSEGKAVIVMVPSPVVALASRRSPSQACPTAPETDHSIFSSTPAIQVKFFVTMDKCFRLEFCVMEQNRISQSARFLKQSSSQ